MYGAGEHPCVVYGDEGVVAQNVHAQRSAGVGHLNADRAQADDAQRLACKLRADEILLAGFYLLFDAYFAVLERAAPFDTLGDLAGGQQQAGQNQFLYGVCICAGGIESYDALLGHAIQRQVVHACACAADAQQLFGKLRGVHVCAADDDGIGIINVGSNVVFVRVEHVQIDVGDRIQGLNIIHAYLCSISNFFMNSASARTPSMGMAL